MTAEFEFDPIETANEAAGLARQAAGLLASIPEELRHMTLLDEGCLTEVAIRLGHFVEYVRLTQTRIDADRRTSTQP